MAVMNGLRDSVDTMRNAAGLAGDVAADALNPDIRPLEAQGRDLEAQGRAGYAGLKSNPRFNRSNPSGPAGMGAPVEATPDIGPVMPRGGKLEINPPWFPNPRGPGLKVAGANLNPSGTVTQPAAMSDLKPTGGWLLGAITKGLSNFFSTRGTPDGADPNAFYKSFPTIQTGGQSNSRFAKGARAVGEGVASAAKLPVKGLTAGAKYLFDEPGAQASAPQVKTPGLTSEIEGEGATLPQGDEQQAPEALNPQQQDWMNQRATARNAANITQEQGAPVGLRNGEGRATLANGNTMYSFGAGFPSITVQPGEREEANKAGANFATDQDYARWQHENNRQRGITAPQPEQEGFIQVGNRRMTQGELANRQAANEQTQNGPTGGGRGQGLRGLDLAGLRGNTFNRNPLQEAYDNGKKQPTFGEFSDIAASRTGPGGAGQIGLRERGRNEQITARSEANKREVEVAEAAGGAKIAQAEAAHPAKVGPAGVNFSDEEKQRGTDDFGNVITEGKNGWEHEDKAGAGKVRRQVMPQIAAIERLSEGDKDLVKNGKAVTDWLGRPKAQREGYTLAIDMKSQRIKPVPTGDLEKGDTITLGKEVMPKYQELNTELPAVQKSLAKAGFKGFGEEQGGGEQKPAATPQTLADAKAAAVAAKQQQFEFGGKTYRIKS